MRLHRNLVIAIIKVLDGIFNQNLYADKVIEKVLKQDKRWGSRDRGFIAETSYEIVRWKRLYLEIAEVKKPFDYQNLWRVFSVWAILKGISLPNWKEFQETPKRRIKGKFDKLSKIRKFRESIPDWMDSIGLEELGENQWENEISSLNKMAPVIIRANALKTNIIELEKILINEEVVTEKINGYPDALKLKERTNLFLKDSFQNGLYEIQDASSQLVAPFLKIEPGMKICDVCAGAGGKTLHLSALSKNKGQIIAMDIYKNKLQELKRRAKRNGAFNIETKVIENNKSIKRLYGKIDRLLIDSPCSGLGVLKRNPDSKWKLSQEFLEKIKNTQQEILQKYAPLIKNNGKLVYATCSILPSENEIQIESFLKSNIGLKFKKEDEKKISPSKTGFDGFYMARLSLK
ncbi:MAG: RsmB/NOP family class I SAM-dependent RNA methyltransferase [Flavobacteriaceae bacterium]|jgi:16S rRNA (cytosine967-C5)-methyltransferase|nr:RsmB/NOP family class I SAM-dependent RNA methyltransferase [Flavobacteriaceae bacterium]MBT3753631.1 RsmB/NOP family class I SAM-dependent RNA methyltransferase [Flavobacteriaceae bacterium]MBT3793993.1 RsmB/NOP family class I SAM-dependent RNA methyltransferase [Flavobacteriaceae bacterium]MBT4063322.1 RsmB/NOP family class I SAM-dependent RNA methyltransferase [Flavobacteriaceae bacterium]MBT4246016.1 RsmB/NOP family class I SAM-dependent RNA methyltransferase [Flavobacteriaceae bacterium